MSSRDAALFRTRKRGYNGSLDIGARGLTPEPVLPQQNDLCGLTLKLTWY